MARVRINPSATVGTISPYIYGHFTEHLGACIYGGVWVGEGSSIPNTGGIRNDVVEALRRARPTVIRWPGGCFADEYDWRDGIGPRSRRPRRINAHWGGGTESNEFGTHEFIRFCRAVGHGAGRRIAKRHLAAGLPLGRATIITHEVGHVVLEDLSQPGEPLLLRLAGESLEVADSHGPAPRGVSGPASAQQHRQRHRAGLCQPGTRPPQRGGRR